MLRLTTSRFAPSVFANGTLRNRIIIRLASIKASAAAVDKIYNENRGPYYTAKDIEFCPNRAKEVNQNNVEETSYKAINDDAEYQRKEKAADDSPMPDEDHMKAYRADNNVSLHSVMQSNVPDPFSSGDKAPTHLNMPGSAYTRDYKYMSEKMQKTHQSRQ